MIQATAADVPRIVDMLSKFHKSAGLPFEFDPKATGNAVRHMIAGGGVLVTERGCIGGILVPAWPNPSWVYACELFWWAEDGKGLRLLRGFEEWARRQGAKEVRMTTFDHMPRADVIVRRCGYAANEISYGKVL